MHVDMQLLLVTRGTEAIDTHLSEQKNVNSCHLNICVRNTRAGLLSLHLFCVSGSGQRHFHPKQGGGEVTRNTPPKTAAGMQKPSVQTKPFCSISRGFTLFMGISRAFHGG